MRKEIREYYKELEPEYYEAICDWCNLNFKQIDGKYGSDLYDALMHNLRSECSPQIEEFWHKVAMNHYIDPKELEWQRNPCNDENNLPKLFKKFPYGETYKPCIEELYHKYQMELDELLDELEIIQHVKGKGVAAVCPICNAGKKEGDDGMLIIIPSEFSAMCLGKGCTMNREVIGIVGGQDYIRNKCHTSWLYTKLKGIFTNPKQAQSVVISPKQ